MYQVNIVDIERVERVSVEVPVQLQRERVLNLHQFEIFLKKEREPEPTFKLPENFIEEGKVNIGSLNKNA